jgi:4-carboxymuconolactone decarboxylase
MMRTGWWLAGIAGATVVLAGAFGAAQTARRSVPARLTALGEGELTDAHREILGDYTRGGRTLYLFRVCVRTPELCRAWVPASRYFGTSPLSLRDRELLILRTCWLTKNEYTWGNHVAAAKRAGLSDEDLLRITKGLGGGWSAADAVLLRAVDELHSDQVVTDATWESLSQRYGHRELSDLIFIVGQYTFVAMWARSGGFPMEAGAPRFPSQ